MHPDSSQAPNMTSLPFQVCLLGDSGVGKTCLLRQYTWDTSGQERFRALTASYYRGTHGIIIVFDITNLGEIDICLQDMNADKSSDDLLEICLIGNLGVGKSCLLERFADDTFAQGNYSFGVGFRNISISTKMEPENDHLRRTQRIKVWDTVGDARYRPMMFEYIRRSHGIVIVYDTTKKGTFTSVRYWLDKIDQHAPKNVSKLLVGTKSDLTKAREVDYHTAKDLAASMLIPFLETSALMGSNVHEVFFTMTSLIKEQLRRKRRT